jgi:hypothetical protein
VGGRARAPTPRATAVQAVAAPPKSEVEKASFDTSID